MPRKIVVPRPETKLVDATVLVNTNALRGAVFPYMSTHVKIARMERMGTTRNEDPKAKSLKATVIVREPEERFAPKVQPVQVCLGELRVDYVLLELIDESDNPIWHKINELIENPKKTVRAFIMMRNLAFTRQIMEWDMNYAVPAIACTELTGQSDTYEFLGAATALLGVG